MDGQFYNYSGPGQRAVQKDIIVRPNLFLGVYFANVESLSKFTSTKTIITMVCGGVDLTATFLSPIEVRSFISYPDL